ncbi:C-type lectin domain family 12 member A-like [Dasypus novemcinctus]|uniref:C-type lectin domain family 12 member A-like n=1 Tax=Dasypus novemcinctus TaxID=9361 RepID=UPI000328A08C|nr:C-type lectin domain family 12 member A-like [Dasypus novemcinctus]
MLNLVVLAGLGTLGLMHYHKFIQFNYTTADETQKKIAQLEKNLSLYMNMYENVSSEHKILKNMSENTSRELKNLTSKYCEDLKLKRKELKFNLCPQSWVWREDSCYYFSPEQKTFQDSASDCTKNNSFLMRIDNKENWNRMQLFVRCLPSPTSWLNLTCILNEEDLSAQNESKLCTDQLTIPINISSVEKVKYEVVDGKEVIESSNEPNSYYICEKEVPTEACKIQNNTETLFITV